MSLQPVRHWLAQDLQIFFFLITCSYCYIFRYHDNLMYDASWVTGGCFANSHLFPLVRDILKVPTSHFSVTRAASLTQFKNPARGRDKLHGMGMIEIHVCWQESGLTLDI